MELLTKLLNALAGREREAAGAFEGLAQSVADGEAPDAGEAAGTLEEARKSPADLKAAVERIARRRSLREGMARAEGAHKELQALTHDRERAARVFDDLRRRHELALAAFAQRESALATLAGEGQLAERELRRTAPPQALADLAAVGRRRQEAEARRKENSGRAEEARASASAIRSRPVRPGDEQVAEEEKAASCRAALSRAARHDAAAESASADLARADGEAADLEKRLLQED